MLRFYRIKAVVLILAFAAIKPHFSFSQCTISNLNPSYCSDDATVALSAGLATNFIGNGVTLGVFDPSDAGPGTHTIIANDRATAYNVVSAGIFNRITPPGTATTLALGKDSDSGALGVADGFFDFDFFGTTYNELRIGSNGLIGLGNSPVTDPANQSLPDGTDPDNIIAALWSDMTAAGTINYWTIGSAPFRTFIIDFDLLRTGGTPYASVAQVKLFESTNIIEIHTETALFLANGDQATQGIENSDGSVAAVVTGRNNSSWDATNDYIAFVPVCLDTRVVTVYAVPDAASDVVPSTATVCSGSTINVTVIDSQLGFEYQLQDDGTSSPLSSFYAGTGADLVIPSNSLASAGTIKVYVRNVSSPSCDATLTEKIVLTINALPAITSQPVASQAVCEGSTANFAVTATGTGVTYQWKKNGVDIGGATANTFSIPVSATADAGTYTVVVSGTCIPGVTSTASVLTINERPEIVTPPATQTVCAGQSVTFTVNAGVTTGAGYQWRKGGLNIGGATGSSYTIPVTVAADAGSYDVIVSGTCTPGVTSAAATLTINALPAITSQPVASQAVCEGSTANFAVTATGTGVTYQWKKNGVDIGGATANTFSIPVSATADAGTYTVVVSGTCTPGVTSIASVLTINERPEIVTPPATQTVCAGQSVTFTVNAGVTTGAGYQWRKGGLNIGGATGSSYTIPVTVAADAGSYDVIVSGTCTPSVTSAAATLTIDALPAITSQPVASQAVCEGSTANFAVTATGTGVTYQWKKNGVDIGGATANTFSIPVSATADAGTYTVVVSGTCTPGVTSIASVLTINERPEIVTPPATQTVCAGQSVTFTVNAGVTTGAGYQWRKGGLNIGGATGSSYTIPVTVAADAGSYDVIVSGTCTPGVTSAAATLTINALPAITSQPVASQAVCEGSTANFAVTATGTGVTYQWKKNGVDIGGATANTFSIPVSATADAGTYTVVVSGTCIPGVTSTASVLTINERPEIVTPPATQTVCAGQSVTFTVNAGVTTGAGYQWRKGGLNIGGATGSSYTIPVTVAADAGSYDVIVSGTCTPGVTSAAATLTINALPAITSQPVASQAVCEGSTANFAVTATGTGVTYQWKKNGVDIGGATANTFSIPVSATADAGTYTVVVSGTCTPGVTSIASVLTINERPEIVTPPATQTVCAGQSVTFTVNAGVTTGAGYQWRKGGLNIGGATGSSYTIPVTVAADAGSYDVIVSGTCTPSVTSAAATLTIDALPAITSQPVASQAVCEGSTANFAVTATGTGVTYQWKKNGVDIGGATANTFSIPVSATADAGTYTVVVSGTCTPGVTSIASVLTINERPEIVTPPATQTVCAGQSVTFTVNAGVTTGAGYQWRKGGLNIGGATGSSYTIPVTVAADAGSYDVIVSGTCTPSVTSAAATLTIDALPAITSQPVASQAVCEGSTANFAVTAAGTGVTYQWKKNGVDIGGATANTFSILATATADAGTYTVVVSGTCTPGVTSIASVLTINERPEIVTPPATQTVCAGQSVTFTVNAGVTTGAGYQWRKGGLNIGGATGSSYTIPVTVAADAGSYDVIVSGTCTPGVTSAAATLTINALPAITSQPVASQAVCEGSTANFAVTATGTGVTYQWKKNGVDIGGATANTFSIPVSATADAGTYTVVVSGTCIPGVTSTASVLTINERPEIVTPPATQTVCAGQSVTFTVNAGVTTGAGYQWRKGGLNIGGATGSSYTIPVTVAADAGSYDVIVSGTCTPGVTSAAATLTINALPAITSQPVASQAVCEGSTANFAVTATGTGVTYQWKKNGVDIGGATANTFSILATATADAGTYTVVVSGTCTPGVTSIASVLTINERPEIVTPPATQTVCAGQSVTFTVNAGVTTGAGYQWRKGGLNIGGATGSSYTIPVTVAADAGSYDVIVSGTCTPGVTSAAATLTINALPAITSQPVASQAVCEGSTANFAVTATGTGVTYQWKKNGVDIGGATANTFSIPVSATADAGTYTVVVSGTCIPGVTSTASVLTINERPEIVTPPATQTVCAGQSVTFTVNAGVTTGAGYQWRKGGLNIGGATGSSYTIPVTVAADAGSYDVIVSGTCTPGVTSAAATLTINVNPVIVTGPVSSTICESDDTSFAVDAGTTTVAGYQWQLSTNGGVSYGNIIDGGIYAGATTATLNLTGVPLANNGFLYRVIVSGTCTPSVVSNGASLTVNQNVVIGTQPVTQTICEGSNVIFTVGAIGSGLTYQWRENGVDIVDGGAYSGATTSTLTLSNVPNTFSARNYTVVVTGTCSSLTSAVATLTVNRIPNAFAADAAICSGQTTNIVITNPNGVPSTTFSWSIQSSTNVSNASGGTGNLIAQALMSTDGVSVGTVTYLIQPSAAGCDGVTYAVTVTVNPIPNAAASPQTICSGSSTSVAITNPNGVVGTSFAWTVFSSTNVTGAINGSGTNISQVLTSTDGITSGNVVYRITPTANGCSGSFVNVMVTVSPRPVITNISTSLIQEICSGTALNFLPTSTIGGTTFNWTSSVIGTLSNVTASGSGAITDTPVNATNTSAVIIYNIVPIVSGCSGVPVNFVVTVRPVPTATASPQTICSGQSSSVLITNPNAVSGTTFTWSVFSSTNVTGASASSGSMISQVLSSTNGISNGVVTYRITPSANGCPGPTFDVTVTVKPVPVITNSPVSFSQQICSAQPLSFVPTASIVGTAFSWTTTITGPINPASVTASGTGTISDSPLNVGSVQGTVTYRIIPSFNGCDGLPVDLVVTVKPLPSATASNQTICSGGTAIVNILPTPKSVAGTTFAWTATPSVNVVGALNGNGSTISQVLSTNNASIGTVVYTIVPTANGCDGPPTMVTVTVNPIATVNAGLDFAVCEPLTIPISGSIGGSATSAAWTVVSGAGTISATTVSGTTVTATYTVAPGDISGNVTFLLSTNDPDAIGPCSVVTDALVVAVNRQARLTLPADYTVCEPSSIGLTGTLSGSATSGGWSLITGAGGLSATSVTGLTVTSTYFSALADVNSTLRFRLTTNDPDGSGPCAVAFDEIDIHVNESAKINAGADFPVCQDQTVSLAATASGTTSSVLWSGGSGAAQFSPVNNVNSVYTLTPADVAAGTIVLTITTNDPDAVGPCTASSDQVAVRVNQLPDVFLSGLETAYAENSPLDPLDGFPLGGTFSGPGIVPLSNVFDPSNAGYGVVTIRYTYTDVNTCTNFAEKSTIVNPVTSIDFYILEDNRQDVNGFLQICANQGPLSLIGIPPASDGIFPTEFRGVSPALVTRITSPDNINWKIDTDGLAAGTYQLQYVFTNSSPATNTLTKNLVVFSAPESVIDVGNTCVEDALTFTESSFIPNNLSNGTIVTWNWLFGEDSNGSSGSIAEPQYTYTEAGPKTVRLEVITDQGCSNESDVDIVVGNPPTPDFTWSSYCLGSATKFRNASDTEFGGINSFTWDFGDGQSSIEEHPKHPFATFGVYDVKLTIGTDAGCSSDTVKQVYILQSQVLGQDLAYTTDFENGQGTWFPVAAGSTVNNSWVFDTPTGSKINSAYSGANAWWTGANAKSYFNNEQSFVIGPCLNLTQLERPMISLKYWVHAQKGFDGAVVQYSTDGGADWETIGDAEGGGISWYNSRNLPGEPGSQSNYAWSEKDSVWRDGRYNLDEIQPALRDTVIFRIAFGSNDDNNEILDGFAFDDIYIGEKKRNVLVEHFTNTSSSAITRVTDDLEELYEEQFLTKDSSDFILVQYHMATPGPDDINKGNPVDPQARALLYGVSQPPTTLMDGIQGDYFGTNFNGSHARITAEELDRRALEDPSFEIRFDPRPGGNPDSPVQLDLTFTYVNPSKTLVTPVTLHAALMERGVPGAGGTRGNVHVVRKLLLGGAGQTVAKSWTNGAIETVTVDYTLDVPVTNPDSLYILAFVQDQLQTSKRVLQAAIIKTEPKNGITIVGLPDDAISGEIKDISIYPNPASQNLNITSETNLSREYTWKMIDQRGITVLAGDLYQDFSHGAQRIDISTLANGIYFIAIQTGDKSVVHRKVAVMNRN